MARLHQVTAGVTAELDAYNTPKAGKMILDFINDLSTWYVRRSRDRMKEQNEDGKNALQVLGLLSPNGATVHALYAIFPLTSIYKDVTGQEVGALSSVAGCSRVVKKCASRHGNRPRNCDYGLSCAPSRLTCPCGSRCGRWAT